MKPGSNPVPSSPGAPAQGGLSGSLAEKAAAELAHDDAPSGPLARIETWVVGGLAFSALALCSFNVVMRVVHPAWTLELVEEVQVYVLVWAVFLSLGSITLGDRHIKADLFVNLFRAPVRQALQVFAEALGVAFALLLLWYGTRAAFETWSFGDVSTTSLRFPLWIYVAALPAGAVMLLAGNLIRLWRRREQRS